jgi:broad specificity phosphatase PhoE
MVPPIHHALPHRQPDVDKASYHMMLHCIRGRLRAHTEAAVFVKVCYPAAGLVSWLASDLKSEKSTLMRDTMRDSIQPSKEFLFLRHGQTDWNALGRLQGRSDRPLDAGGIEQAHAGAERLFAEDVSIIVSSPLLRARQTADVVSQALGVPVKIDQNLIERSFGSLEGRLVNEIVSDSRTGLDIASSKNLASDAEPWEDVCKRTMGAVSHWLSNHSNERILFVGHYGVMSAICQQLVGVAKPAKNATPYRFVKVLSNWRVMEVNGSGDWSS